jgi:hypothetical protein
VRSVCWLTKATRGSVERPAKDETRRQQKAREVQARTESSHRDDDPEAGQGEEETDERERDIVFWEGRIYDGSDGGTGAEQRGDEDGQSAVAPKPRYKAGWTNKVPSKRKTLAALVAPLCIGVLEDGQRLNRRSTVLIATHSVGLIVAKKLRDWEARRMGGGRQVQRTIRPSGTSLLGRLSTYAISPHSIRYSRKVVRHVSEKAGAASRAVAMPTLKAYLKSFLRHRSRTSQIKW